MTEKEEMMMFAAFALAGIVARDNMYHDHAARQAWNLAEQMMFYKPREEKLNDD